MKKICFSILLLFYVNSHLAQALKLKDVLEKITVEKNDNNRIDLIYDLYFNTLETNPALGIRNAQQVLLQSQKQKDKIAEAMALCMIGANYRQLGNTIKGLEYNFKAMALAEATTNLKLVAVIKNAIGNVYNDREEYTKALELYLAAENAASKEKCVKIQGFAFINLGKVYLTLNKADSALIFTQRAYELSLQNNFSAYLGSILTQLGGVQAKLGNESLAVNYYGLGIKEALKTNFPRHLYWAYLGLAQYYAEHNNFDSCKAYSKKAIAAVQNTPLSNLNIKPAKMLLDLYENKNSDSAMKYFKIYKIANDSLFSTKAIQQTQLMTFEEEIRQAGIASEKLRAKENRKKDIQYVLITIGIFSFIIIYLLLSRSIISNSKIIEFLGVVSLLIVFEFLNLFLHPFLENITNHSPILMLLGMVCIASLLVPLHHKIEKFAKVRLVEKNKKIRLAAAKKTIEELEGEN